MERCIVLSDLVHLDVLVVKPTKERPLWTLVTSGMSDKPMNAPEGMEDYRFAELVLCLPGTWNLTELRNEENYWPVRLLKTLARFPPQYNTWLAPGHTDPPQPFRPSTKFCCAMLGHSKTVNDDFGYLELSDKVIHLHGLYLLYLGEMELKLKKGLWPFDELFKKHSVSELLEVSRTDTTIN